MTSFYGSSCANNSKGALNTPESPDELHNNITSFCGSSCANNGKGALNTPEVVIEQWEKVGNWTQGEKRGRETRGVKYTQTK
eukprot:9166455-Pyramimonas_sp.AAC.1